MKSRHVYGWYVVAILLSSLSMGEFLGGDVFAGIIFSVMAGVVVRLGRMEPCHFMIFHVISGDRGYCPRGTWC